MDGPEAIAGKVQGALHEVGLGIETSAPYLLQLLGVKEGTEPLAVLTPEAIKTRTFETLRQMSLDGSQRRPLVFEIEDLHWCDNTSEDYLTWLVESMAGAAMLLLVTYRPGYRPPWLDKSYTTQIALRHLAPQDSMTVVRSARQYQAMPGPLEQMIITKAEGNPFFLEELTRAVLDRADVGTDVTVPDTIQGVLMARIDRLPEAPKRLLQTAAVLGREIAPPLLEALWDGVQPLAPLLLDLTRQEFLFARASAEGTVYVFKHALTQEVAYESLLTTRRQTLHAAAGRALETLYAPRLEDAYDRLAYHYARTDNVAKAVTYLTRVAEKAARHSAHVEAISRLTQALELLPTLPATPERNQAKEQGFPYQMAFGAIMHGWALAQQGQAKEGIEQITQGSLAYRATGAELNRPYFLALLAEAYGTIAQPESGLTVIAEALTLAETTGDRWYGPELYRLKGTLLLQQSADNHAEAQACFQQALDVARSQQVKSLELRAATSLGHLWQEQGKRTEARQLLAEVYDWFTEGFDTPDLWEAKALLAELA